MKTIKTILETDDLKNFLFPIIGRNTIRVADRLKAYRIEKKSQLIGLAQRKLPKVSIKTAQIKGLSRSYLAVQRKIQPELVISQFQKAMGISRNDAIKIYNKCIRATVNFQRYNYNSSWAFGTVKKKNNTHLTSTFWYHASEVRFASGFFIVPGYQDTGPIFDQGERGTCVANALCSAIDYATNQNSSRQFIYHQSKMVDGIPTEEGTFIETAVNVLCDKGIEDLGNIGDSVWPYNPYIGKTTHQGPPPVKAFNTKRIYTTSQPVFARENRKVEDIMYLLNCKAHDKTSHKAVGKTCLVVIGVAIHESFFSYNTADTGWITMPLPGEAIVGYHAMAICGYDEKRKLFLVRNSWGPHWAHNNDMGFVGHAWIPFEYIEKFCHVAVSLNNFEIEFLIVQEDERLYNKKTIGIYAGRIAATINKKQKFARRSKSHISLMNWLVKFLQEIIFSYAYNDPIIKAHGNHKNVFEEHLNPKGFKNKVSNFFEDFTN